ncbi:MAG: hypothetical protein WBD22_13970 [Pyrinomonadaceae bacterium]
MKGLAGVLIVIGLCTSSFSQDLMHQMLETERAFAKSAFESGPRTAFVGFLADDSIIFRPNALNGTEFWRSNTDPLSLILVRKSIYSDIASNGLMGYTTGNWRTFTRGKGESQAEFGQFVSIWEKRGKEQFQIALDIETKHDKLPFFETDRVLRAKRSKDLNKRGWSPADASMNFFRDSMGPGALGGAYERFAADDVRILIDRRPPILGKKYVVSEMKRYLSIAFPARVVSHQAADMAYVWNPCEYANSNEGLEKGNCLHVWKLRNKKWWIVLGVFAAVPNDDLPTLKRSIERKKKQ